jgi:hypothetical protein
MSVRETEEAGMELRAKRGRLLVIVGCSAEPEIDLWPRMGGVAGIETVEMHP